MMDTNTNEAFSACKCKAAEELTLLREEMHLKEDENTILRIRLTHGEEAVKR